MLEMDVAQVGHGAVIQPKDVAQEADIGPRPKHTGEEPQPHLTPIPAGPGRDFPKSIHLITCCRNKM